MADLKISELNSLAGADLVAADVVAVVDDSASETKKLTVSDLIANGTTLISDNTIPSAKILFAAGAIDTAELAASAVETAKINDSAVTAAKLADNSSVTLVSTLPASGDFTGQIALDTDDNKIYIWDGSAWDSVKGAGSINVVNGSTTGEINIVASTSGDTVTISATLDDTSAAAQFLGGPTGAGGTVGYRALVGTDLPTASTSAKGGVIVNGNGLAMSGDTITIDNTVTAETSENHIVQYDANGLVTGGRAIVAGDIPIATTSVTGAVKPGSGLEVTATGDLNHSNTVTGATATKVTFDAQGHITATEALVAADIPDLDTSKITTGTFPEARIGSAAVSGAKLKDYAVAQISETTPTADFVSQLFFNPITRDLFMWDGNVFQPIGISAGEIVLAGTYDASTNLLDSVTADGSAAGFTNGASLPAASTGNNRHYVVVSQSGTGSAPAPTVTLEPPDILLSNGTSYVLIETSETITAQIASNVGFTPTGNIAGTNVQAAVAEVDSEKLAKAGDTMTGDLTLNNVNIVFEGATENDYETTLTVTDPTADRTITLPNVTGTVVTTGDTGSVTSTMITDGTIVNADISASAEIAVSKLANGTARQVLQTDSLGTGVEFSDDLDLPGTLDVTGAATLDSTLDVTGATTVTGVINADGKVKFPAGSASAPSFYSGTDTNTGLYFSAADEISVATGGTQRVVIDSSGVVRIGGTDTYNSSDKLTLVNNSGNCSLTIDSTSTAESSIFFADGTTGSEAYRGYFQYQHSNDALLVGTAGSERMRIDSSGNVGIGTSSPNYKFHVSDTSDAFLNVASTGTIQSALLRLVGRQTSVDEEWNIVSTGAGLGSSALRFVRGTWTGTPSMLIDSSGNVGIGTTSPSTPLHVKGGGDCYVTFEAGAADGNVGLLIDNSAGTQKGFILYDTDDNRFTFGTNDTERMRIDSSGRLGLGTSSPSSLLTLGGNDITGSSQKITYKAGSTDAASIEFVTEEGGINRDAGIKLNVMQNDSPFTLLYAEGTNGGRVGIGSTAPTRLLTVQSTGNADICIKGPNTSTSQLLFGDTDSDTPGVISYNHSTNNLVFEVNANEAFRVDSSRRLLVGTSSSVYDGSVEVARVGGSQFVGHRYGNNTFPGEFNFLKSRGASIGTNTIVASGDVLANINFLGADGSSYINAARISTEIDGTPGSNDMPGRLVFSTTADGASSPTERMRIGNSGIVYINTTDGNPPANSVLGTAFREDGSINTATSGSIALTVGLNTSDGTLVQFRQAGTIEGAISVSGTTVTYGGGHLARWSQLPNNEDPSFLLKGTVLSNLDEMCEWGEEANEQLNRTKVSDVEGDPNVAGVFVSTSFDESGPLDFFCAMTGDMVIRIAQGTTVARGDLLMSAGDGTAKPQDDDIVRSKTIAKVTSTTVSETYSDGSYCVPCVLMAC